VGAHVVGQDLDLAGFDGIQWGCGFNGVSGLTR
jgi:hypothetical protein